MNTTTYSQKFCLTDDERAIDDHWLTKGDQGMLFLIIEGSAAFNSGFPATGIYRRCMIAAYTEFEDGYAYCGPKDIQIRNLKILTGLSGRWDLEPAREMWRTFLADGWKYQEEWARIPK